MGKGYFQVYTGNGKGKTTAALGLALRAAGAGLRTFIAQFIKGARYSEITALKRFDDLINVQQYGTGRFIYRNPSEEDRIAARKGLEDLADVLAMGKYDLVIMDEADIALHYNLFTTEELLKIITHRDSNVEAVVTGRRAPQPLLDAADLVTEMREIKHYYHNGVKARVGIEK
ncbi:MAG: cob(I)yrinic acid a,c-diamide adenosyltransferase [Lentisphaeria bacterium]